ncbi:MAG: dihydrolipoyl dehydrogenase [Verrucomicrobia bacterium]|nr:dihydrolipoyl dehydrogenase [Verrucomicrobiota bacterium]MBV9671586.1 dihydrolipoyl dehydrogenase [Verrucomicrobiota bacterium]
MAHDLVVVGGGPAGYVGAIRAAQLGKKVACVEKERAGGTCLNWGCIPTKSLLRNAEIYELLNKRAADFGFKFDNLSYDWPKVISRSRKIADRLAGGVEFLFKKHNIDYVRGEASLPSAGQVSVKGTDGRQQMLETIKILVATGAVSRELPGLPTNGKTVVTSHDAMIINPQPKRLIIIGAGAIGVEFAYFFNAFGTQVTIVEMLPNLLPIEDIDVSTTLERSFVKQGIQILTNTKVVKAIAHDHGVEIQVEGKKQERLEADCALVAIGVAPLVPSGVSLKLDNNGFIAADNRYQTNIENIFAAGDVIGPPWLAHVASWEALQAVEGMFTDHTPKRIKSYPGCTYCQPQVASVGLTERAAKEKGLLFKVGKFPFSANGKALAVGESEGFVKLIIEEKYGEILGAHIIGPEATELIAELGLAIHLESTYEEIEETIHAHPTLSEAIHEASGAAWGQAIHI